MNENCMEISVTGRQSFMGKEIPVVLGGFGADAKCICDKTVAEIHGMETKNVRARITDNITRFRENVDYIDMKNVACLASNNADCYPSDSQQSNIVMRLAHDNLLKEMGYSQMEISKSAHIYVLSERGYAKLVKIMDTDTAWEIYENLLDEYFYFREIISSVQTKTAEEITAENKLATAQLLDAKRQTVSLLQSLWTAAGIKPEYQVLALNEMYKEEGVKLPAIALQGSIKITYDKSTIAKKLGVLSKSGRPHAQAVGAIIRKLDLLPEETENVPYSRNGHDGFDEQYAETVVEKVWRWLDTNGYPTAIKMSDGKTANVCYQS